MNTRLHFDIYEHYDGHSFEITIGQRYSARIDTLKFNLKRWKHHRSEWKKAMSVEHTYYTPLISLSFERWKKDDK